MGANQHSRLDGDDPRIEYISRAVDYVPLRLYDEIQKPAEEAIGELIHEHNGLLEQYENLKEQLDGTGKAAVREARRSSDFLARAENAERKWAIERDRANGLLEQLETYRVWLKCASDERDGLKEQFDALLKVAEGLFQMIDRETWRATGGDDQQGHYEGDYRAAQIEEYLVGLRASNPATRSK